MSSVLDKRGRGGFTLIEILLVLVLSSILFLGINGSYRQAFFLTSKSEYRRLVNSNSLLVIETIRGELAGLYFPKAEGEEQIPFELSTSPEGQIELRFFTLSPCWKGIGQFSPPARITYHFMPEADSKEAVLERTERSSSGEKTIGIKDSEVLLKDNFEFKLWCIPGGAGFSNKNWQRNLQCTDSPPKALKILIEWPESEKFSAVSFESILSIPCRGSGVS